MMRVLCRCGVEGTAADISPYAHHGSCPIHPDWSTTPPADYTPISVGAATERIDEPAKRYDAGKPRIDLIPPEFIEALGRHFGAGSAKYGERNWEKGMSWSRCYASAMRHLLAFWSGEELDPETGTPHVISAAWNMAALHWYGLHDAGTDDRPHTIVLA